MRVLPFGLLLLGACSWFQEGYREFKNEEMEGRPAPPIEGGQWVGVADLSNARWTVLAFFNPD